MNDHEFMGCMGDYGNGMMGHAWKCQGYMMCSLHMACMCSIGDTCVKREENE